MDVHAERRDAEEAARIVNTLIREYQQHVEAKPNEFPVHGVEVISEADPSDHRLSPDLFRHMTFHAVVAAILMLLGGVLIVKAGRRKGNVQQGPPPIPGTPRERLDGEG